MGRAQPMISGRSFPPPIVVSVEDERSILRGYFVIDSTVRGRAVGGVRMLPDVSMDEIRSLARTMTLKYAFAGLSHGGAKAGIVGDPEQPAVGKQELLVEFFRALAPILRSGAFTPRPDMGTSNFELRQAMETAGLKRTRRGAGFGDRSGLYTGFGVVGAALAGLERLGIRVNQCSVAVEGFGKVGSSVARLFVERGAKVVALSTRQGAIYSSRGLNIPEAMRLHGEHGSGMVGRYADADRLDTRALLELDVDVLSPCARFHSIDGVNAPRIAAKIISGGANNPVTAESEQMLYERGKLCLPDFVTSTGGMLGEAMEYAGLSESFIKDSLVSRFRARTGEILKQSEKRQQHIREYLEPIILERFHAMKAKAENPDLATRLAGAGKALYRRGLLPKFVVRFLAPYYFSDRRGDNLGIS